MKFNLGLLLMVAIYVLLSSPSHAQVPTDLVFVKLDTNFVESAPEKSFEIKLIAFIKEGYHINSNMPNDEFLIPTKVISTSELFPIDELRYPAPHEMILPISHDPVSAYDSEIAIGIKFRIDKRIEAGNYKISIELIYQACNDQACFPPDKLISEFKLKVIREKTLTHEDKPEPTTTLNVKQSQVIELPEVQEIKEMNDSVNSTTESLYQGLEKHQSISSEKTVSLVIAIVFALIGGIILNLMPCVLPVLSLKIMGIVQQAGEKPKEKLKHGILFTLGVLVSFWILAGMLILLRSGGEQLGWGFQLQSPSFVIVLSILLFLFGLSMFGVFEIGASLTSAGQGVNTSAYYGSFLSGILATVVATPCTAPFMGSALGFALSQPAYVSLLVFTFLGLGMALPYLVLTTTPKLMRFIPKPGLWMETMKQFMGFLIMATVLWLLWVLSLQTGADGVIFLLGSLMLVSIGGWVYGRWGNLARAKPVRLTAQGISILILIIAIIFSLQNIEAKAAGANGIYQQGKISWQMFSPELVKQFRSEGKPVFIDFTAAWCLSCQVNEKVAFGSDEVQKAFNEKSITTLKADWTNKDETITKALAEFERNSVPFYVLYIPNKPEPIVFPEILTPGIVLDKLKEVE